MRHRRWELKIDVMKIVISVKEKVRYVSCKNSNHIPVFSTTYFWTILIDMKSIKERSIH